MTRLQQLVEVLQKDESIHGLDQLIVENFYNQEKDEYNVEGIRYFILTEYEVQDLLDEKFENELYEASEKLRDKGHYEIADLVQNLDMDYNYLRACKDAEKVDEYIFIGKTNNYYIFQE